MSAAEWSQPLADEFIKIKIEGEEKLIAAIKKFPQEVAKDMGHAGFEAGRNVYRSKGLANYPRATASNRPPVPYYIRTVGMQTSESHNTKKSENLGKQWYVRKHLNSFSVEIGNRASYAKYLHGTREEQNLFHYLVGWRSLYDVVEEKMMMITRTYNAWVNHTLKRLGLQ